MSSVYYVVSRPTLAWMFEYDSVQVHWPLTEKLTKQGINGVDGDWHEDVTNRSSHDGSKYVGLLVGLALEMFTLVWVLQSDHCLHTLHYLMPTNSLLRLLELPPQLPYERGKREISVMCSLRLCTDTGTRGVFKSHVCPEGVCGLMHFICQCNSRRGAAVADDKMGWGQIFDQRQTLNWNVNYIRGSCGCVT